MVGSALIFARCGRVNFSLCRFFEWCRDKGQRQPYFIYFSDHAPSEEMMELASIEAPAGGGGREGVEGVEESVQDSKWEQPTGRMLTMAGLFDIWRTPKSSEAPLYTYTIITVESCPSFSKIHHRMPAVLGGQEAVGAWLDPTNSARDIADLLHPVESLSWHPVSPVVNNSRNHTSKCVVPYDIRQETATGQKTTLMKWFTPQSSPSSSAPPSAKRPKFQPSQ
jgi:putative SOS response-associated peptidase YedK